MCKIMIMSGITNETKDKAWEFIHEMSRQMSNPHCVEKDGLGYSAIDAEGNMFGERWVNNSDAFKNRNAYGSEVDNIILKKFKILTRDKIYGNFGTFNDNIRSITLHSRMSTNTINYKNTHPFVEGSTSLIHNGVISNHMKLTKKTSSCDSEVILHEYIKQNVMNKPHKFQKVANKLEGYYALGIFSKTSDGTIILDVVKDDSAKLEAFFIKELNTVVFATPKWGDNPVVEACKVLGFQILSKYEVKSNRLQRLNALTGETIQHVSFKPASRYSNSYYPTNPPKNYSKTYPYSDNYSNENLKFDDMFPSSDKKTNVIDLSTKTKSHSQTKHSEVKERLLEEMLMSNSEYTEKEVKELMDKVDVECDWTMDERLAWHKKNMG